MQSLAGKLRNCCNLVISYPWFIGAGEHCSHRCKTRSIRAFQSTYLAVITVSSGFSKKFILHCRSKRPDKAICDYLREGNFPKSFPSTKPNFIKKARKFTLGRNGILMRDGRPVVKYSQRSAIFKQFHQHRGNNLI